MSKNKKDGNRSKAIYTIAAQRLGISQSWVSKIMNGYCSLDTARVLSVVQDVIDEVEAEERLLEEQRLALLERVENYKKKHREVNQTINSYDPCGSEYPAIEIKPPFQEFTKETIRQFCELVNDKACENMMQPPYKLEGQHKRAMVLVAKQMGIELSFPDEVQNGS